VDIFNFDNKNRLFPNLRYILSFYVYVFGSLSVWHSSQFHILVHGNCPKNQPSRLFFKTIWKLDFFLNIFLKKECNFGCLSVWHMALWSIPHRVHGNSTFGLFCLSGGTVVRHPLPIVIQMQS
jgi:hypothetical protein